MVVVAAWWWLHGGVRMVVAACMHPYRRDTRRILFARSSLDVSILSFAAAVERRRYQKPTVIWALFCTDVRQSVSLTVQRSLPSVAVDVTMAR